MLYCLCYNISYFTKEKLALFSVDNFSYLFHCEVNSVKRSFFCQYAKTKQASPSFFYGFFKLIAYPSLLDPPEYSFQKKLGRFVIPLLRLCNLLIILYHLIVIFLSLKIKFKNFFVLNEVCLFLKMKLKNLKFLIPKFVYELPRHS